MFCVFVELHSPLNRAFISIIVCLSIRNILIPVVSLYFPPPFHICTLSMNGMFVREWGEVTTTTAAAVTTITTTTTTLFVLLLCVCPTRRLSVLFACVCPLLWSLVVVCVYDVCFVLSVRLCSFCTFIFVSCVITSLCETIVSFPFSIQITVYPSTSLWNKGESTNYYKHVLFIY